METITLSRHNSDTREGEVRSRYSVDAPPLLTSNVGMREHGRIEKAVRAIEQAAYERGVADVLAHAHGFRPNT